MNAKAARLSVEQQADKKPEEDVQKSSSAAAPGSVNQYEVAVLYHPDLEIDLGKATAKVEKVLTDSGAKITNTDNWGKRKLAYPINKLEHAVYVFYSIDMPGQGVRKVEQTFNITDEVIRFLIIRPDVKAMAKAEALKAEKAKKAAERGSAEESAESEEPRGESAE